MVKGSLYSLNDVLRKEKSCGSLNLIVIDYYSRRYLLLNDEIYNTSKSYTDNVNKIQEEILNIEIKKLWHPVFLRMYDTDVD